MKEILDVAIIGGGASGLCTAVSLKQRDRSLAVGIFEQLPRVGKKLITTGNGRCNITNKNISKDRYHGEDVSFADYALSTYDNLYTEAFFADLGVVFTYEEDKIFPMSLQASSVVDALRFYCDNSGVLTVTDTKITEISKQNGIFSIKSADDKTFYSKSIVVASGLYSGGEKLGSTGSILKLLKQKGYKISPVTPSIVQLKTDNKITKSLKGIKVVADVTLYNDGKPVKSDSGEVLFCDYGLSGPPVMQISRAVSRDKGEFTVELDICPLYSFSNLCDLITFRVSALRGRTLEEFFTGMLNKRVGQQIVKLSGKNLSDSVDNLTTADVKKMASIIKNLQFEVVGTTGFQNSQVSAGGLKTQGFNPLSMMSKAEKGLFAVGEILDIDGDCGGFNLQWAWSSAFCAADGIINYLM